MLNFLKEKTLKASCKIRHWFQNGSVRETLRTKPSSVENWFNILNKYLFKWTCSQKGPSPSFFCISIWLKLSTQHDIIWHGRKLVQICLFKDKCFKKQILSKQLLLSFPLTTPLFIFKQDSIFHKAKGKLIAVLLFLCCSQILGALLLLNRKPDWKRHLHLPPYDSIA